MEIHEAESASDRVEGMPGYRPIENYGIIGDLHTTALVGMDGSIDWLCLPRHDSPSVFAAILDDEKGGRFTISPDTEGATCKQLYWPDTNVLVTRFFTPDGVGEVTDYMPIGVSDGGRGRHQIIRRVEVVRGTMTFRMECTPAFDYARKEHETRIVPGGATFHSSDLSLGLASFFPLQKQGNGAVAEFTLREEESTVFVLRQIRGKETTVGSVFPRRKKKRSSCGPWNTGGAGSRGAPTRAAGARWSVARPLPSSCSPTSRRVP